jgi:hypothetical protein
MNDTSKINEKNINLELRSRPQQSPNWGRNRTGGVVFVPSHAPRPAPPERQYRLKTHTIFNTREECKVNDALCKRTLSPARHAPPTPQLSSRFDSRATHARTNLPAALASVPFGFTLARVRVRFFFRGHIAPNLTQIDADYASFSFTYGDYKADWQLQGRGGGKLAFEWQIRPHGSER